MNEATKVCDCPPRRDFFKRLFAGVIGAVLGLVPVAAGFTVLFDPLRRKAGASGAVRVTTLDSLPQDGIPRKFAVIATRTDAWNKYPQAPIGAVYLRRTSESTVEALNVVCPHAGCPVDFLPARRQYLCPCHNSTFSVAGRIDDPGSPAARGMDSLEVEIRAGKEVWVKFQNFQAGVAEKIPA